MIESCNNVSSSISARLEINVFIQSLQYNTDQPQIRLQIAPICCTTPSYLRQRQTIFTTTSRPTNTSLHNHTRNIILRSSSQPQNGSTNETQPIEDTQTPDDLLIEQQITKRRPKPKPAQPAPGSYKVISAARDQVYGDGPRSAVQQFETAYVSFLTLIFVVILGEGVFLAASGFLSEAADQFAQDVVYPAFSPTVILFLAGSTFYGLWKTGGLGRDTKNGSEK